MGKVLIACNDNPGTVLHDFFESCADEAKAACVENNINYTFINPPNLNEKNLTDSMSESQLCVIAAHGDADGIYNEEDKDIVSKRTTNYNFKGKFFYSVACSCAQNLSKELNKVGLRLFVGYKDPFNVVGEQEPFVLSAMSGLKSFLSGKDFKCAKADMLNAFDQQISSLENTNFLAATFLLNNKESLYFEGDENISFSTLIASEKT